MTVDDARACAGHLFPRSPTPLLDAECILAHILSQPSQKKFSRADIFLRARDKLTTAQEAAFCRAAEHRARGLPVAYITGAKEFFGFDFYVTPDVLIPKPDTEILVEKTLAAIAAKERRLDSPESHAPPPSASPLRIADVCTGSGCVAISLALCAAIPLDITASDISPAALKIAQKNAERLLSAEKKERVRFEQTDLLDGGRGQRYDIILSNPPYIPSAEAAALLRDGRNEPLIALDGGNDGLDITRRLITQTTGRLVPGGVFLTEIDERDASRVTDLLASHGFTDITIHSDLDGKPRVAEAVR
jgi:release factor glutamine methyltransferase